MPKYKVLVRQYVEEIAEIEVEADNPHNAAAEVEEAWEEGELDPDWSDGSSSEGFEAFEVQDLEGKPVLTFAGKTL